MCLSVFLLFLRLFYLSRLFVLFFLSSVLFFLFLTLLALAFCFSLSNAASARPNPNLQYVKLVRDLRKCAFPLCGGYFVVQLNVDKEDTQRNTQLDYISALDFSGAPSLRASFNDALIEDLIFAGNVRTQPDPDTFAVKQLFRALPGVNNSETNHTGKEQYLKVSASSTASFVAVNLGTTIPFAKLTFKIPGILFLDTEYLKAQTLANQAIIFAKQGANQVQAQQVYLLVPQQIGPCKKKPTNRCTQVQTAETFTRDPLTRCLVFDKCVRRGFCPLFIPVCPEGYTRQSWAVEPNACPSYTCDPTWTVKQKAN